MEIQSFIFPILQFAVALIITTLLTPLIISYAKRHRVLDQPDFQSEDSSRKIHTNPTPRLGGTAMILGYMATVLMTMKGNPFGMIILSSIFIFLLGLYDDIKNISPSVRLIIQAVIALFAVTTGNLVLTHIYWTPNYFWQIPYWVGLLFSVFVIVGAVNATNMIDGLDGLAGGIILITITLICYILFAEINDNSILIFIGLPLAGAILGFLRFNTHPASIFMGDGGSNWLGFYSGTLILLTANKVSVKDQMIPLVTILLCFAIPILDTLFVISRRILKGKNPVSGDQLHMHFGLMRLGMNQAQTVTLMYFLAMILGLTGILPLIFPRYVHWTLSYFAPSIFLLLLYYILKREKAASPKTPFYSLLIEKKGSKKFINELSVLFQFWEKFNRFILYFILIVTPILTGGIQNQVIGIISGVVFFILGIFSLNKKQSAEGDFLYSFVLSLGALMLLISNNLRPISIILLNHKYLIHDIYNVIFIILTISILLYILLTFQKKYLLITATDFLMLSLPLILILVPDPISSQWNLNIIAIRSIVLFITIRIMIKRHEDFQNRIRMIIMISLMFLFLTGVFGMKIVY